MSAATLCLARPATLGSAVFSCAKVSAEPARLGWATSTSAARHPSPLRAKLCRTASSWPELSQNSTVAVFGSGPVEISTIATICAWLALDSLTAKSRTEVLSGLRIILVSIPWRPAARDSAVAANWPSTPENLRAINKRCAPLARKTCSAVGETNSKQRLSSALALPRGRRKSADITNDKKRGASFMRVQRCKSKASDGQVLCPGLRAGGPRVLQQILANVTGGGRKQLCRLRDVQELSVRDLRRGFVKSASTGSEPRLA
jgi:hypothetical protein